MRAELLFQTVIQRDDECTKSLGLAARQLFEILEPPADRAQLRQMRSIQKGPVRSRANERAQKLALICISRCRQLTEQLLASLEERGQRHRLGRHTRERSFVGKLEVLRRREQYFVDRTIVAGEVHDKGPSNVRCDTTVREVGTGKTAGEPRGQRSRCPSIELQSWTSCQFSAFGEKRRLPDYLFSGMDARVCRLGPFNLPMSLETSQAFAILQSRLAVPTEMPSTSAVSSISNPPK